MTSSPSRPGRKAPQPPVELVWQIYLPWLALASILLTATGTDPDLWGHVRFGLDWLQTRALPAIDPYSFTQDKPWVNHEWLSEALMGAAFTLAGTAGLVLLKTMVVTGTAFGVWRRLRGSTALVSAGITTLAIAGALPLTTTVRPQIWSLLALTLLVPLLDDRPPTPRRILSSAALFGVWANLHGGWITGGAALALHVAIRSVRRPSDAATMAGSGHREPGGHVGQPLRRRSVAVSCDHRPILATGHLGMGPVQLRASLRSCGSRSSRHSRSSPCCCANAIRGRRSRRARS